MPRYALDIKPSARKELEKSGCGTLHGYKDLWRIRVGDYRVVYIIDDDRKIMSVTRVAHRRNVYE